MIEGVQGQVEVHVVAHHQVQADISSLLVTVKSIYKRNGRGMTVFIDFMG